MSNQPSSGSIVIKFFAPVNEASVNALMQFVDQKVNQGVEEITILMSTPGGSVFHGLTAYNYLKGLPIKIITHNFGSVISMGVVMFCAGEERYSSPQATFLIHGVTANFAQRTSLEEPQLEERLKSLKIDYENIAKVIAANAGKKIEEVKQAMLERTTLNPEEAKDWGLIDDVKSELFEQGAEVISIQGSPQQNK